MWPYVHSHPFAQLPLLHTFRLRETLKKRMFFCHLDFRSSFDCNTLTSASRRSSATKSERGELFFRSSLSLPHNPQRHLIFRHGSHQSTSKNHSSLVFISKRMFRVSKDYPSHRVKCHFGSLCVFSIAQALTSPPSLFFDRRGTTSGELPPFNTDPEQLEILAKERLSAGGWSYASCNASLGSTDKSNRDAFSDYKILPRMLVDTNKRDTTVKLFGKTLSAPICISPIGINKVRE